MSKEGIFLDPNDQEAYFAAAFEENVQRISIHHQHPNIRNIKLAVEQLQKGGVIAYPTDTVYGLGCDYTQKKAIERLYSLRELPKHHHSTFLCHEISQISEIALFSNRAFRLMKRLLPGPYTFILDASREVPNTLLNKQKTVGIRIPGHDVPQSLVREMGRPIITTSATSASGEMLGDPDELEEQYQRGLSVFLDAGFIRAEPSTVISLVGDTIEIIRVGKGPVEGIV
jgi:tRNA threonylcarbamoyl adenosine modification protein (Sua5/YciO/YrdC/YwlC family)